MATDTRAASCCRSKSPLGNFETFSPCWRIPRKINTQVVSKLRNSHATQSNPMIIESSLSHLTFCLISALKFTVRNLSSEERDFEITAFLNLSGFSLKNNLSLLFRIISRYRFAPFNVFNCKTKSSQIRLVAPNCTEVHRILYFEDPELVIYIRGANSTQGLVLIWGPFVRGPALLLHEGAPFGVHPNCPPRGTTVSRAFSRSANSTGG